MTNSAGYVAILAGGGDLPLRIAASVTRQGRRVHVVAIKGEAEAWVEAYPHTWVNLGQASRMFAALKAPPGETGVMVIAGAVTRPDLAKLRPDFGLVRVLMQVLGLISAGGDDALLTRAIRIFEREGLTVVGVQDVAPELLIGEGVLGRHGVDAQANADIARGHDVLAVLGGLDVGQAIAVEGGRVLAIEGAEGTDRMLGRLAERGAIHRRAVLLKAPKPRQERRVDLPTIGLKTIERAHAAGIRGIAVVAGATIGLQRDAMIAAADAHELFVAGVPGTLGLSPAVSHIVQGADLRGASGALRVAISASVGRPAKARDLADVSKGLDAVLRLAPFDTGMAAAVVRGHVVAISAVEGPAGLLLRAASLSQWGLKRFAGKRGAVILRLDSTFGPSEAATLLPDIAKAGFAGLALVAHLGTPDLTVAGRIAAERGLFLVVVGAA